MTLREMIQAIMDELGIEKEESEDSAADTTEDLAEGETKPEKD